MPRNTPVLSWLALAALATLVTGGGWAAHWRASVADADLRAQLTSDATAIADTINVDRVRTLSFSEADTGNPAYDRLRSQMTACAVALGQLPPYSAVPGWGAVYSRAMRGRDVVAGPGGGGTHGSAPPGGTDRTTPREVREVFKTAESRSAGPYSDGQGGFVSGFAPVTDPRTGAVVMVIGVDLPADAWHLRILRCELVPWAVVAALACLVLLMTGLARRRAPPGAGSQGLLGHAEEIVTAACCVMLTVIAVALTHEAAVRTSKLTFTLVADQQASRVRNALHNMRDYDLAGLARSLQDTADVTPDVFRSYAAPLAGKSAVRACEWLPRVLADQTAQLEARARSQGIDGFAVFELGPQGSRRAAQRPDVLYPVYLVEPLSGNESVVGLDAGSEPARRAAIEEAARTGLPTATDAVDLLETSGTERGIVVFSPVAANTADNSVQPPREGVAAPRGFAAVVLELRVVLAQARAGTESSAQFANLDLFQADATGPAAWLASSDPAEAAAHASGKGMAHPGLLNVLTAYPVFASGKSYLLLIHPGPAWLPARPGRVIWPVGLAGLLLSGVLTAFVAVLRGRSAVLGQQVTARTAELRIANEGLRRERDRAQHYLDTVEAIIVALDREGRVTLINRKGCEVLGYDEADLLGEPWFGRCLPQPDGLEVVYPVFRGLVGGGGECPEVSEGTVLTRSGELRLVEWHSRLLRDDGVVVGMLSAGEDVTERRRLEEERVRLGDELVQARKLESVGQLAGGIAHDMNNLLAPILAYADLIQERLESGNPQRERIAAITRSAERAKDLVARLLAFARKQSLQMRPLDLNAVVARFAALLRRSLRAGVTIETSLARRVGTVSGDEGQIEQVILNLVLNAQDAMPEGGVVVVETGEAWLGEDDADAYPDVAPGQYVTMCVADTGIGMDEEALARAFEPFYTTKGLAGGAGLGLSTVHGIVKQHGGHVEVASEVGSGTTVRVYLPRVERGLSPERGAPRPRELSGTETLLVAEDEDEVRALVCTGLRGYGYTVLEARSGEEALGAATSHDGPIDLLVTDVILPGMDGRQLHEGMAGLRPATRVLYMSGYTADVLGQDGMLDPSAQFLPKPFTVRALARKVREVLDLPEASCGNVGAGEE